MPVISIICRYLLTISFVSILSTSNMPSIAQANTFIYSIKIASYKNRQAALNEVAKKIKLGLNAFHRFDSVKNKGKWYRIYIGKYDSKAKAENEAKRLKRLKLISNYYIRAIKKGNKKTLPHHLSPTNTPTGDHGRKKLGPKGKKLLRQTSSPLFIKEITYKLFKGKKEIVYIRGDRYFWPSVFLTLDGEREPPKLIIEAENAIISPKNISDIHVKGEWIQQIRIRRHLESKTVSLQLDFVSPGNYQVTQDFDKEKNIFIMEISIINPAEESKR